MADRRDQVFSLRGFDVSIEGVPYEFQRGGNKMMRILRTTQSSVTSPLNGTRASVRNPEEQM